jgi:hypothetical protein
VVDDGVDRTHGVHLFGGVRPAEEEDLAGELLPDLLGQIRAAITAVEAADVGVGLLEPRVLSAGQRQITGHVQAVATAGAGECDGRRG